MIETTRSRPSRLATWLLFAVLLTSTVPACKRVAPEVGPPLEGPAGVSDVVQQLPSGNYEVTPGLVFEWLELRKEVKRLRELLRKEKG